MWGLTRGQTCGEPHNRDKNGARSIRLAAIAARNGLERPQHLQETQDQREGSWRAIPSSLRGVFQGGLVQRHGLWTDEGLGAIAEGRPTGRHAETNQTPFSRHRSFGEQWRGEELMGGFSLF